MFVKCAKCDPTITLKEKREGVEPIKSIDLEIDDYVKEGNKYYHTKCYKEIHMNKKRKPMTEQEVDLKIQELKKDMQKDVQDLIEKDNFYKWIMNRYDGSLPAFFCNSIADIRSGKHKRVNEEITYKSLLEMYEKLENYLNKQSMKINFNTIPQRMNYELAVVLGNYGDYKKWKAKQQSFKANDNEIQKHSEVTDKVLNIKTENEDIQDKDFDITDVIDDLLL